MQKTTHEIVGGITGVSALYLASKNNIDISSLNACLFMTGAFVGSLIPDIDHTQSTVGRKVPILSYPIAFIGKICSKSKFKFIKAIGKSCSHRGILHSGILYAILTLLTYYMITEPIIKVLCLGLCCGCFSHLIADTFNPSGIPWLLPLTFKRFHIMKISTGSIWEKVFRFLAIVFLIYLIYLSKDIFLRDIVPYIQNILNN